MLGWDLAFLAVLFAAFLLCFAVQMICTHLVRRVGYVMAWLTGFACGGMGMVAAQVVMLISLPDGSRTEGLGLTLANLLIYAAYNYGYFAIIQSGVSSVSTRILLELRDAGKGLTLTELLQHYSARDMLDIRLDRLVRAGQLILKDGRYYPGKQHIRSFILVEDAVRYIILGKRPRETVV